MEAETSSPETRAYHHYSLVERALAVITYVERGRDLGKTAAALQKELGDKCPKYLHQHAEQWEKQLLETGSLADRPRPGAPPKMTREQVEAAADALERGIPYAVRAGRGQQAIVYVPAFSYNQAITQIPELAAWLRNYGVTEEYLREHIKAIRPELQWVPLRSKVGLLPQQEADRQRHAQMLFELATRDGGDYLMKVFWEDEVAVVLLGPQGLKTHIWRNVREAWRGTVFVVDNLQSPVIIIRMALCVNGRLGFVAKQYLANTTGLGQGFPRVIYPEVKGIDWEDPGYTVSEGLRLNRMHPSEAVTRIDWMK